MSTWVGWRDAMATGLYGPAGFYRAGAGPEAHFRTSVTTSPVFGEAVHRLLAAVDELLGTPAVFDVVDVGAGDGSLLCHVLDQLDASQRPRWRMRGVELRPRPDRLPREIGWDEHLGSRVTGVIVAHELLDNVPVDVVEVTDAGLRVVEVDTAGAERLGAVPDTEVTGWLDAWWPLSAAAPGVRAEVGLARDREWLRLLDHLERGLAVAVDYTHSSEARASGAWAAGTLTGYRDGHQVRPVPDGSCDLTAHVALDSCAEAGRTSARVSDSLLTSQRDMLMRLGLDATLPPTSLAHEDPAAFVYALGRATETVELLQRGGLGDFGWLLQTKGIQLPSQLRDG